MNLQLSLIKKWFDLTGTKAEDYRDITPYWCSRFLLHRGEHKPVKWWNQVKEQEGYNFQFAIRQRIATSVITFKKFDYNIMTLGYPKSTDTKRIKRFVHDGIEARAGNPEWGAVGGRIYFVIKHGKQI